MPRLPRFTAAAALGGVMLLALTVSDKAAALQLYGSVGNGSGANRGDIISINPTYTNSYTTIGNPTVTGGITGLAFDNSAPGPSGSLWGSQGFGFNSTSTLIEIDPGYRSCNPRRENDLGHHGGNRLRCGGNALRAWLRPRRRPLRDEHAVHVRPRQPDL